MNLHDITPGNPTALIWGYGYGGNGHTFGDGRAHLFHIERGTPPPLGARARRNWLPYQIPWNAPLDGTKPACGITIPTRARHRHFAAMWRHGLTTRCDACMALGGEYHSEIQQADPYYAARTARNLANLTWDDYQHALMNLVDPVTGQ